MNCATVAIIGTAGRKDGDQLRPRHLGCMKEKAKQQVADWGLEWSRVRLVSGGAAWADHVAVLLFLESLECDAQPGLTLYMPCPFLGRDKGFEDTGDRDWRTNPGRAANYYHRSFSSAAGRDSLLDIECALAVGAVGDATHRGFHARNREVAKAEYLIAFTFGTGQEPAGGGTLHTWKCARGRKVHLSLPALE